MTKPKHTPGPWHWYQDDHQAAINGNLYVASSEGDVCEIGGGPPGVRRFNARLIAAAPELLAALKSFVELANKAFALWDSDQDAKLGKLINAMSGGIPGYRPDTDAIHAIIAKAERKEA